MLADPTDGDDALCEDQIMKNPNEVGRIPIGDALPGTTILPLEDGDEAVAVYAIIKTRDAAGVPGWSLRTPEPMNDEEFLGILTSTSDWLRHRLLGDWDA